MKPITMIRLIAGIAVACCFQMGCVKTHEMSPDQPQVNPPVKTSAPTPAETATTEATGKVPIIEVENPVYDMGAVSPGNRILCEFRFKNAGTADLHIEKILSTCQCTVPELEKKDYAPGESGVLKAYYTASSYEAPVLKHLHILSDDPKNPRFELAIKGRVEYRIQVSPEKLSLFLNKQNAAVENIVLKSKDGKPFSVVSFTSTNGVITAEFDKTVEKSEWVIKPVVDTEKLAKNLNGSVDIRLTHPETNHVSLGWAALPLYVVSPPRFVVRDIEPGQALERTVWIKSNYQDKVEIESITSLQGYMEVIEQKQEGDSVKLQVKITPPAQEGKTRRYLSDSLTVKAKDGEALVITLSGWYKVAAPNQP
jgi:hypothetical protein